MGALALLFQLFNSRRVSIREYTNHAHNMIYNMHDKNTRIKIGGMYKVYAYASSSCGAKHDLEKTTIDLYF